MEMKNQIVSEEDLIAFIAEGIEQFKPEEPTTTGNTSSWVEDEESVIWNPELVTEEEVARENGCWIDDDGHWIPMDDEYDW